MEGPGGLVHPAGREMCPRLQEEQSYISYIHYITYIRYAYYITYITNCQPMPVINFGRIDSPERLYSGFYVFRCILVL